MTKLITLFTFLIITNISIASDCHNCDQGTQPGSVDSQDGIILLAEANTQPVRSIANAEAVSGISLAVVCARAKNGSLKSFAEAMTEADLNFKDINDLNSFTCKDNLSLLETMLDNSNDKTAKKLLYYLKTRKGEEFVKNLLNYRIPNRNNDGGFHTILDFANEVYNNERDDEESRGYVDEMRKFYIAYGAKTSDQLLSDR